MTGGSYVLLSIVSVNLSYQHKTGGSYVLVSVNLPYKHKTGGSYVLLSFMSFNFPYKYKTGGSYVLLSFVSVNFPYKYKTGGSYVLLSFVSVNLRVGSDHIVSAEGCRVIRFLSMQFVSVGVIPIIRPPDSSMGQ